MFEILWRLRCGLESDSFFSNTQGVVFTIKQSDSCQVPTIDAKDLFFDEEAKKHKVPFRISCGKLARDLSSSVAFSRLEIHLLYLFSVTCIASLHPCLRIAKMPRTKHTKKDVPLEGPEPRITKDTQDTKSAICNLADDVESEGSFTTSGVYAEAPVPDLFVQGFGPFSLPLAKRDADAICEARTELDEGRGLLEPYVGFRNDGEELMLQKLFPG